MWPHSVSSMNTNVSEAPLRRLLNCLPLRAATKKATSTMGFMLWFTGFQIACLDSLT